jgi:uncharacterized protein YbjQ (UPF0145 family)
MMPLPGRWTPRLWIAVPLILAGCVYQLKHTTQVKGSGPLGASYYSSAERIEVVTAEQVADRPYRQLGLVHAPGSMAERDAIAELKLRARAMGGEALLNVRKGTRTAADPNAASSADTAWQATVIVWTDKHPDAKGGGGGASSATQGTPPPRSS